MEETTQVRAFAYRYMIDHEHPPTLEQTAVQLGLTSKLAQEAYRALHEQHMLYWDDVTGTIRMLNPFSGIKTSYIVHTLGHQYYANCAWDLFGIVTVLKSPQALLESICPDCGSTMQVKLEMGRIVKGMGIVHFLLPFREWYEDLIYT